MTKQQRRKPPKRQPGRPKIDDDLVELASVLSEQIATPSVESWFSLPWRDGWNAALLGWHCFIELSADYRAEMHGIREIDDLADMVARRDSSTLAYETAEMNLSSLWLAVRRSNRTALYFAIAGLRCAQLVIASSSGGGHVYNDIWKRTFERVPDTWSQVLAKDIREARCVDAIGVGSMLQNDRYDRLRRAFTIAWDRGLYQVAYALPRAS